MPIQDPLKELRSITQIAKLLHVHPSSVWRWISVGVKGRKLRSILVGGRRAIYEQDLQDFLSSEGTSPTIEENRMRVADERLRSFGIKSGRSTKS